jgi:hypothetical protein
VDLSYLPVQHPECDKWVRSRLSIHGSRVRRRFLPGVVCSSRSRSRSPPLSPIPCGIDGGFSRFRFWRPRQWNRQCSLAALSLRLRNLPIPHSFQAPSRRRTSINCAMW